MVLKCGKNFLCFISTRLDPNPKLKNKTFAIIRYESKHVQSMLLPLGTCVFCVAVGGGSVIQLIWKGMMTKSILCNSFPVKDKEKAIFPETKNILFRNMV